MSDSKRRPLIVFMTSLAPTGGIERDALKCFRALLAQGRELHIAVAFLHPDVPKLFQHETIHWYHLPSLKRPPSIGQFFLWRQCLKLEKKLKTQYPGAVSIAFEWMPVCDYQLGGQPPRLWWQARAEMGLTTWARPLQRAWEQFVERQLFKRKTHFAVYSQLAKKAFIQLGFDEKNISRVVIPTNFNSFQPRPDCERKDILIIGTNPSLKGIDVVLHAWPGIYQKHPELSLNIVGKGWKLRRMIDKHPHAGVRLSPLISDPQRYYQQARLVLAPSRFETWCNVVPEALACGLPVLSSQQTPASELIDQDFLGYVINRSDQLAEDAKQLSLGIEHILQLDESAEQMWKRHHHVIAFQAQHQETIEWITQL